MILLTLASAGVAIMFARLQGKPKASDFGLCRPPLARAAGLLVAIWLATMVVSALWVVLVGIDDSASNVADRFSARSGVLNAVLVVILATIATRSARSCRFSSLSASPG